MPTTLKQRKPLVNRKPMNRGKGMRASLPPRVRRRDLDPPPPSATLALHRGTYAASTRVQPATKTEPHRNRHLLDMARGGPCLRIVPGCTCQPETSVAAHGNSSVFGKGGARKADDFWSVRLGAQCHTWLDAGTATKAEKLAAFMAAHHRQVLEWRRIAADPKAPPADRKAANWALGHLNATPVGREATP